MDMHLWGILLAIGIAASCSAGASEKKAYKIVDEKGNVTYSQTPPNQAKSVQKVDISPASSGRGGNTESRDLRQQQQSSHAGQRNQQIYNQQQKREEAEQQRIANLKAECHRNRGSDCDNPEALRLIEAQKIPGGRNFR
jgi:hypothetical protein